MSGITRGEKYFLSWFDKHCSTCAECKKKGLMSTCPTMVANRRATERRLPNPARHRRLPPRSKRTGRFMKRGR